MKRCQNLGAVEGACRAIGELMVAPSAAASISAVLHMPVSTSSTF